MIFSNTKLVKSRDKRGITIMDHRKISRFYVGKDIGADLTNYSIAIPWSAATPVKSYSLPRITEGGGVHLILSTVYQDIIQYGEVYMYGKPSSERKTTFFPFDGLDDKRRVCVVSHAEPSDVYCVFWTNGDPETYYFVTQDHKVIVRERYEIEEKTSPIIQPIKLSEHLKLPSKGWTKIC